MSTFAAATLLALFSVVAFTGGSAFAQAAAQGCPPGQPPGRPPGAPPGNPPVQTGRPQYPPGRCQLGLSQSAGQRGDTFQANGGGFVPGETVTIRLAGRQVASAVAGDDGTFVASITVPKDAPIGRTEVLASGQSQQLGAAFEVVAAPAASRSAARTAPASLPRTGAQIAMLTLVGLALVVVGWVTVVAARRRRPVSP